MDCDLYFNHFMSCLYSIADEADLFLCGGDFNACIGNKFDSIDGIDSIPRRQVLENDTSKHCEPFIDFLLGAKLLNY